MKNGGEDTVSLQVSCLKNIEGDQEFRIPVLIKNITDDNITCEILLPNNEDYIQTVLYPGWNSELITGIRQVQANKLQYGF